MLPIVTRSGLVWLSPDDRTAQNICGCITYVLARAWGAHRDALNDPCLAGLEVEAYQEYLNRLAGEAWRGIDWRPRALAALPVDDLERIYWFLITREDPSDSQLSTIKT